MMIQRQVSICQKIKLMIAIMIAVSDGYEMKAFAISDAKYSWFWPHILPTRLKFTCHKVCIALAIHVKQNWDLDNNSKTLGRVIERILFTLLYSVTEKLIAREMFFLFSQKTFSKPSLSNILNANHSSMNVFLKLDSVIKAAKRSRETAYHEKVNNLLSC